MLEISCAFATSFDTPGHVRIAEELGYRRAWLYDSPALYPDVWVTLALAAERTSRIGLGPGVLVPSLRHPMTNAAAIAQLCYLAPGRVEVAIGSGFTGRMTFGQRPLTWQYVRSYVATVKTLLRGEKAQWEGRAIQMMQPQGFAPHRPIEVPFIIGAGGPKGLAAGEDLADGAFVTTVPAGQRDQPGRRCIVLTFGTVLGEGEEPGSDRVLATAGHGAAVALHAMYERGMDFDRIPGGAEWKAAMDTFPENERHLRLHDLHLIGVSEHDRPLVTGDFIRQTGSARTVVEWEVRLRELEEAGATEIAYQPAGPDIPGELRRFAEVAGIVRAIAR
ncbi:MAG: LLM class flavin-dependent oxidoreductase [Dehalococcoidia bacterium]